MIIFYQIRYSIAKVRRCLIRMVLDRVAADPLTNPKELPAGTARDGCLT